MLSQTYITRLLEDQYSHDPHLEEAFRQMAQKQPSQITIPSERQHLQPSVFEWADIHANFNLKSEDLRTIQDIPITYDGPPEDQQFEDIFIEDLPSCDDPTIDSKEEYIVIFLDLSSFNIPEVSSPMHSNESITYDATNNNNYPFIRNNSSAICNSLYAQSGDQIGRASDTTNVEDVTLDITAPCTSSEPSWSNLLSLWDNRQRQAIEERFIQQTYSGRIMPIQSILNTESENSQISTHDGPDNSDSSKNSEYLVNLDNYHPGRKG